VETGGLALTGLRASRLRDAVLLAPAVLTLLVLFGGALAGVVLTSLRPLGGGTSTAAWEELLDDPAFGDAVRFTLQVTALSTALAALAALGLAATLRRHGPAARSLVAMPVPVPHLLVATVAVLWLAPGGLADRILGGLPIQLVRDQAGLGIVAVYVYKEAPFLLLLVLAAMGDELVGREDAAAVMGLSPLQRLRWVTWPAVRAPLLVGCIIVAAFVIGSFEVPLTIGPNHPTTLSEFAFQETHADLISGESRAAAAMLLATVAAIALALAAVHFARDVEGA
jgi:putative spermidine/putrescine transport system permease protein